jgi:hypothetical protein
MKFLLLLLSFTLVCKFGFSQTYPTSTGTNTSYEYISNVNIGSIDNTTTGSDADGDGDVGYDDFTTLTAALVSGSEYTLSVTISPDANDYINAWIDWNDDGDFVDAGESYTIVANTGSAGPHTTSVSVPASALGKTVRMRVSLKWNAAPASDESFSYGEVEDYSIIINPWVLKTIGSWDSNGKPNYLDANNDVVEQTDIDSLIGNTSESPKSYLWAGHDLTTFNNGFISKSDIEISSGDSVWITFLSETAGYKNCLGFYTYSTEPTEISDIDTVTLIYPNSSLNGSGGSLVKGNRVLIGVFPDGAKIGWVQFSNAWESDSSQYVDKLPLWTNSYYSQASLNPSSYDHTAIFKYNRYNKWIFSFEDLNLGDKDYADVIYWVTTSSGGFSTLPVSLISFDAELIGEDVELRWATASEINNDYFVVQRSLDNINFEDISQVDGNGNSNIIVDYSAYDFNVPKATLYYRLKQVDFDGTVSYSDISVVHNTNDNSLVIYPNPSNGFFNIETSEPVSVVVTSISGQEIGRYQFIENTKNKLDLSNNAKGIYILTVVSNNNVITKRIVVE